MNAWDAGTWDVSPLDAPAPTPEQRETPPRSLDFTIADPRRRSDDNNNTAPPTRGDW